MCNKDAARKKKICFHKAYFIMLPIQGARQCVHAGILCYVCVDLLHRLNVAGHDGRLSHSHCLVSCVEPERREVWRAEFPVRLISRPTQRLAKPNMELNAAVASHIWFTARVHSNGFVWSSENMWVDCFFWCYFANDNKKRKERRKQNEGILTIWLPLVTPKWESTQLQHSKDLTTIEYLQN